MSRKAQGPAAGGTRVVARTEPGHSLTRASINEKGSPPEPSAAVPVGVVNLIERLPEYYRKSPPVCELERVLGLSAGELLDDRDDVLAQLWVETATWGLARWEAWCGLATDRTQSYAWRRQRVLARLRGQGTTTAGVIAGVVASFGFAPGQVQVVELPAESRFQVVISGLTDAVSGREQMQAAVDEIKPGHLAWYFVLELAPVQAQAHVAFGAWTIQEYTIPAMQED